MRCVSDDNPRNFVFIAKETTAENQPVDRYIEGSATVWRRCPSERVVVSLFRHKRKIDVNLIVRRESLLKISGFISVYCFFYHQRWSSMPKRDPSLPILKRRDHCPLWIAPSVEVNGTLWYCEERCPIRFLALPINWRRGTMTPQNLQRRRLVPPVSQRWRAVASLKSWRGRAVLKPLLTTKSGNATQKNLWQEEEAWFSIFFFFFGWIEIGSSDQAN